MQSFSQVLLRLRSMVAVRRAPSGAPVKLGVPVD